MINDKLQNCNEDNNLKNHQSEAHNNMIVLAMIMSFFVLSSLSDIYCIFMVGSQLLSCHGYKNILNAM